MCPPGFELETPRRREPAGEIPCLARNLILPQLYSSALVGPPGFEIWNQQIPYLQLKTNGFSGFPAVQIGRIRLFEARLLQKLLQEISRVRTRFVEPAALGLHRQLISGNEQPTCV
jgi:hypothetical protein